MKIFSLLISILLLSACNPNTMIEQFADYAKEEIARNYFRRIIEGDTVALAAELDPALRSGNELSELNKIREIIPKNAPTVTNLVGYNVFSSTDTAVQYNLTYQFGYGSKWILANVAWRELPSGKRQIIGLSARPLGQSLQVTNAFSFSQAGPLHYLVCAAMVVIPLFVLVTLITCIRTKLRRRKWLWILFILVGVVQVSFNWANGKLGVMPLSFQLFGASAFRSSIYTPWVFAFSIPLGAIVFWFRRGKLMKEAQPPMLTDAP